MFKTCVLFTAASVFMACSASAADIDPVVIAPSVRYKMGPEAAAQVVNADCRWQEHLMSELVRDTKQKVVVSPDAENTKGRKLSVTVNHSTENTPASKGSPRWLELSGKLTDQDRLVGEFTFMHEAYSGSLQDCKTLDSLAGDLADDLAEWLKNPVPSVKIAAVTPVWADNTIDPDVENTCPLTRKFPETLVGESDGAVQRTTQDLKTVPGKKLLLKVVDTRLLGGGVYTGGKWVKIVGSLVEGDQEIGNFIAMRHSYRAWTSCGMVDRLDEEISKDILKWLKKPMANAKLGDADASTTAVP